MKAQVFRQSFTWDALGNPAAQGYPSCLHAHCANIGTPERTITNLYDTGFLTAIPGYATSISYHPNGMMNQLLHSNGVTETGASVRPLGVSPSPPQGSYDRLPSDHLNQ